MLKLKSSIGRHRRQVLYLKLKLPYMFFHVTKHKKDKFLSFTAYYQQLVRVQQYQVKKESTVRRSLDVLHGSEIHEHGKWLKIGYIFCPFFVTFFLNRVLSYLINNKHGYCALS